jgi:DNA topoisomerase-6 subunit B
MVSPFIKFKNASKETVDASDELVEEMRRALIQAGQRLSRHIKKEAREADLEEKLRHIEQFCPILVDCLCRITKAPAARKQKAMDGLIKLLGRDMRTVKAELQQAEEQVRIAKEQGKIQVIEKEDSELPPDPPPSKVIKIKSQKGPAEKSSSRPREKVAR